MALAVFAGSAEEEPIGLITAIARSRAEGEFVPLADALESLGVDPSEVEALLADRASEAA
jgi:hypothetical protein